MENCFGMHGWKEFHRNRKDILAEFDRLYEITGNRPVKTAHGIGVEAYIRKWLSEFLPKKWAVTSGYVIPTLYKDNITLYHYDIIIYDALNAPVLWTEGNQDDSVQGKYRAIPAKNVAAILEVKSRLNKKNINDMVNKLSEINSFKDQLPDAFFTSGIFIDLMEDDNRKSRILESIFRYVTVCKFTGAMVLRYEGDLSTTGLISIHVHDKGVRNSNMNMNTDKLAKPIDDLAIRMTEDGNVQISECGAGVMALATDDHSWSMSKTYSSFIDLGGLLASITWSRSGFAEFCIDILSSLEGLSYDNKDRPSFGRIFDSFERKPAERQPPEKIAGMPFIDVAICKLDGGAQLQIKDIDGGVEISFCVQVTNSGDIGAVLSDDHFRNKLTLPAGHSGSKVTKIKAQPLRAQNDIAELRRKLANDGICLPYRIVYFPSDGEKVFYAIEKKICIKQDSVVFES